MASLVGFYGHQILGVGVCSLMQTEMMGDTLLRFQRLMQVRFSSLTLSPGSKIICCVVRTTASPPVEAGPRFIPSPQSLVSLFNKTCTRKLKGEKAMNGSRVH